MDIEKELQERISRMGDVNRQLIDIQKKIGTLQEEGKAICKKGLELKGAIDALVGLQMKEKAALDKSATAKLTLPIGVKPIIPEDPIVTPDGTPCVSDVTSEKPVEIVEGTVPGAEAVPTVEVV